jgi:nucleoside-diphosphate-sugar epimerase
VNFTSIRPVYIYGPLNYNPVEEYFFHRLKAGRPIVVPGSGIQVRPRGAPAAVALCVAATTAEGLCASQ